MGLVIVSILSGTGRSFMFFFAVATRVQDKDIRLAKKLAQQLEGVIACHLRHLVTPAEFLESEEAIAVNIF